MTPRITPRALRAAAVLVAWLAAGGVATAQTAPPSAPAPAPAAVPPTEAAAPVPVYDYEIVARHPHDPEAFTQGLVVRDGVLFESTGRFPSTVRRVRLEDGEILTRRALDDGLFGEGLTELDGRVFSLTWRDGRAFVWDATDLTPRGEFAYEGEGWGLTHDGTRLILSDGTPTLRFFDPQTFSETGRVTVSLRGRPIGEINELEVVDGEVWANLWRSEYVLRIDPASGRIVGIIDLTGLLSEAERAGLDPEDDVLNGIAWDANARRLFVTGKKWPVLFEIRLTGPRTAGD